MKCGQYTPLFFLLLLLNLRLDAQKSIRDSVIDYTQFALTYEAAMPGGDLADRFGFTNIMGIEAGYKFKNNFFIYTGAKFLFGNDIREAVATNVTQLVPNGNGAFLIQALGQDGRFYDVRFFERGVIVPLVAGRILPLPNKKPNPNSGFYVEAGIQFLQHKIRIEVPGNAVPNLGPEYVKGYDRLTNGIGLKQGIGYTYSGNQKLLNFFIGLDFSQNFTQSRRDYNFDTGVVDTKQRLDLFFGLKLGWRLLVYPAAPADFYIY